MMTGGKMILTYKRKRPPHWIAYKRKRPPSRKGFSQDNECHHTSIECPSCNAPAMAEKQDESTEGNKPECPMKDYQYAPEEKQQFSGCMKEQDCVVSAEKASIEEDKNLCLHDMRRLAADSHAVLEGSPRGGISQNASRDQLSKDLHNLGKSNSIREGSCSYVNSGSAFDGISTDISSVPLSANCFSGTEPHKVSLKSSVEESCAIDCMVIRSSEKFSFQEPGFPVEDKSSSLCINATVQSKLSSPLITFYRRCKRKKDVNGLSTQNTLGHASTWEATPPKSGLEDALVNMNTSEKIVNRRHSFDAYHEKIVSGAVEYSCALAGSSPETGNVKQADPKLENKSRDYPCNVEVHPQSSSGGDLSSLHNNVGAESADFEGPISCSGNLSKDAADHPSDEPLLFNHHTSVGKESQSLSKDGLNTVKMTDEIPRSRGSIGCLDLSVPPLDCHDEENCDIALVHDERSPHNSHSGSVTHTTLFDVETSRDKALELLCWRNEEREAHVLQNSCLSEDAVGHKYNNFANSSPVPAWKNNYLQLFPEDRTDDMFQSRKMHQKFTASADSEERTVGMFESRSHDRPVATKSSPFLGLFLPMELINDRHERNSTSSLWPNVGVQSKEFIQDTVPQCFPDQASSFVRHKMVLDKIVSRARTLKQKRGSCIDWYDSPTMWSEEELDSLWVGVRRYGRGNWEVMLRDARLHFSPRRTPMALAEQWETEQFKLFNTVPFSQGRHLRTPNIFGDRVDGFWHPKTGKKNLMDEVQLSLGDVSSQPNDSVQKRSVFDFIDAQNIVPRQHKSVSNTRAMYSCRGNSRRAMFQKDAMTDAECSFSANHSICMATREGNLPHWLREVISIPPRPPQTILPSASLSFGHVEMQCVKNPCFHAKEMHHELGNRASNKHTTLERGELQTGSEAHNGNFSSVTEHDKTEQDQHPVNKQDLIIIDSDASSEETISDDGRI